jgi:hypothetical protein
MDTRTCLPVSLALYIIAHLVTLIPHAGEHIPEDLRCSSVRLSSVVTPLAIEKGCCCGGDESRWEGGGPGPFEATDEQLGESHIRFKYRGHALQSHLLMSSRGTMTMSMGSSFCYDGQHHGQPNEY